MSSLTASGALVKVRRFPRACPECNGAGHTPSSAGNFEGYCSSCDGFGRAALALDTPVASWLATSGADVLDTGSGMTAREFVQYLEETWSLVDEDLCVWLLPEGDEGEEAGSRLVAILRGGPAQQEQTLWLDN
jgi:hypothetical protein